jgi:hypothetical protein
MLDEAGCAANASKPVLRLKFTTVKDPGAKAPQMELSKLDLGISRNAKIAADAKKSNRPGDKSPEQVGETKPKKPYRGPPRSNLPWPPRNEMFAAVMIEGTPVSQDKVATETTRSLRRVSKEKSQSVSRGMLSERRLQKAPE